MVKGFSTKKIKTKKTLGEFLRSFRLKNKISISDAEEGTKIKERYLIAIEESKWNLLPERVFVRGFIIAYGKYLNAPLDIIMKLYEKEAHLAQNGKDRLSYNQTVSEKKVLVTPKILAYFALFSFVCMMLSYIVLQIIYFTGSPNLMVTSPENNALTEKNEINLSGVTDPDTFIIVNNENVSVTSDGHFQLNYKLQKGINVIKVIAVNKAKKETSQVYTVEYKPKTASIDNSLNQ